MARSIASIAGPATLFVLLLPIAVPGASLDMVAVPAGEFRMGGPGGDEDELPAFQVRLSAFAMDRNEVTAAEYDTCVQRGVCTPAHYDDGDCLVWSPPQFRRVRVPAQYRSPSYPVVCVTWDQARRYCAWAGKRLPSEAQWEYAAAAGTAAVYAWGDAPPAAAVSPSRGCPAAPGAFSPNGWGLNDMSGNVWEWTADWYQRDRYAEMAAAGTAVDPAGPDVGYYRVIRGGGWHSGLSQLRIRNRHWFAPSFCEVSIGFRCVK